MEEIHLISAMFVFAASVIPIYLSFKLKNNFRILTILLSAFAVSHGFYHILYVAGFEDFSEQILQSLSVTILIVFGIVFLRIRKNRNMVQT